MKSIAVSLSSVLMFFVCCLNRSESVSFSSNPFSFPCTSRSCRRYRPFFSRISTKPNQIDLLSLSFGRSECKSGTCQYYYNCRNMGLSPPKFCSMNNGFTGVCCRDEDSASEKPAIENIRIETNEVKQIIENLINLENELRRNDITPKRGTNEFSHQNFFGGSHLALKEMNDAFQVLETFINFAKRGNLSFDDIVNSQLDIRDISFLASLCEPRPVCSKTIYRKPDGTCNNLINTAQGKAVSTFSRLLPPDYSDQVNSPRRAKDGSELPNARLVSLSISPEGTLEDNLYSLMLMQFGQFIDHDISRTAITQTHDNNKISCCDTKVLQNPRLLHPACFSITVPAEDTFLKSESQSCINFVRSAPAINPKCRFGPREQLNQLSSYIDGNNIYGASQKESANLRFFRGGLMKISSINNKAFPPKGNDTELNCQIPKSSNLHCFVGGDIRANEVVDLVVLHTVFLREHNRIANVLQQLNPSWNDEILYQETKRIVVAELQHIIYNEFLPLILGAKTIEHFGLRLSNGYSDTYNQAIDPSILNEFSTAAYRLHSLIQGTLDLKTQENQVIGQVLLRDVFSNPSILYQEGVYETRIAGLTGQTLQNFDNFFTRDITNHLFQAPGKRFGLDLVALNIQRGRDHGIQGYVKYREVCGLSKVRSFDDLKAIFSNPSVADVMKHLYKQVEDVDLFIAGTSEKALPGAIVGPTFACIIGEQFRRIKDGDRFWYENGNFDTSFQPSQLAEIKKASLAKILCDNSDIEIMQPFAFMMPSQSNPKVFCNQLPSIDLNAWRQL